MLIVGFGAMVFTSSLFVPHGTPAVMVPLIAAIEFISFMVRPFSLGLRLFVAMIAGHILMEVFGSFIVSGLMAARWGGALRPQLPVVGVAALELLVAHPGLRVCPIDDVVPQRRNQPSLIKFSQGVFTWISLPHRSSVPVSRRSALAPLPSAWVTSSVRSSRARCATRRLPGQQGRLFIGFAAAELLGLIAFAVAMIILYALIA